jgi:hypothetical protein
MAEPSPAKPLRTDVPRPVKVVVLVALLATVAAAPAAAVPLFTFDALPSWPDQTFTPFSDTSDGVTATFSSATAYQFFVFAVPSDFSSLTGKALINETSPEPLTLDISFSGPFRAGSLLFWLSFNENLSATLSVEAFSGGIGGTSLGVTTVSGEIPPGFDFPEGVVTLDFGSRASFDALRITSTSPDFAIDDLALRSPVPEPATLSLLGLGLAGMGARRWRQRKGS